MAHAGLKFGIFMAPFHRLGDNPTLAIHRDLELIEHLDRLGFDEAWVGEHHSTGWEVIASPELFLAGVAQHTHRIKLGTGVVSLPYHHPFTATQRMVQLDHMSGGRVIFGIGVNTTGTTADAPAALRDRIVTLPDLTGRRLPRQALLVEFLPRFLRLLGEIDADPRRLIARYRPLCALDGHPLTIHRAGGTLRGVCRGIAADGALVLDTPAGRVAVISGSLTDPAEVWRGDASAS